MPLGSEYIGVNNTLTSILGGMTKMNGKARLYTGLAALALAAPGCPYEIKSDSAAKRHAGAVEAPAVVDQE